MEVKDRLMKDKSMSFTTWCNENLTCTERTAYNLINNRRHLNQATQAG
jgi:hypothetical protein